MSGLECNAPDRFRILGKKERTIYQHENSYLWPEGIEVYYHYGKHNMVLVCE